MGTWNSRGLRGSTLEDLINRTIEQYRERRLAVIQKVPTPITPVNIDKSTRHITLAYFDKKSTVDYIGAVQGIPVCFDAKECASDTFPLQNIHEHQVSFLLIYFSHRNCYYYMRCSEMMNFWNRSLQGGRKSFLLTELDERYFLPEKNGFLVPFLDGIRQDLEDRD